MRDYRFPVAVDLLTLNPLSTLYCVPSKVNDFVSIRPTLNRPTHPLHTTVAGTLHISSNNSYIIFCFSVCFTDLNKKCGDGRRLSALLYR